MIESCGDSRLKPSGCWITASVSVVDLEEPWDVAVQAEICRPMERKVKPRGEASVCDAEVFETGVAAMVCYFVVDRKYGNVRATSNKEKRLMVVKRRLSGAPYTLHYCQGNKNCNQS